MIWILLWALAFLIVIALAMAFTGPFPEDKRHESAYEERRQIAELYARHGADAVGAYNRAIYGDRERTRR
mgnify:CR=1 FL=1